MVRLYCIYDVKYRLHHQNSTFLNLIRKNEYEFVVSCRLIATYISILLIALLLACSHASICMKVPNVLFVLFAKSAQLMLFCAKVVSEGHQ